MREIKFRVWDKETKKFKIKDEKLNFGDIKEFLTAVIDFEENSIQVNANDRYEFLQYTGFKDKNDKEVYDGYIVKFTYHTWSLTGRITKNKFNQFCILAYYPYFKKISEFHIENLIKSGEIIGNIYENLELLER